MYRIAISDDNPLHLEELYRYVKDIIGSKVQSITKFNSASDIEEYIDNNGFVFDIVLMDIKYQDEKNNGIDIAKLIHSKAPTCQIIFVTAFLRYAPNIFEVEHTYFVMKTELGKRLPEALRKAERNIEKLRNNMLSISNKSVTTIINTNDILYLERIHRITQIVTTDNIYTCYESIEELLKRMDGDMFLQTHKSYAVNLSKIHTYQRNVLTLINHKIIPISRVHWKDIHDRFMLYIGNSI